VRISTVDAARRLYFLGLCTVPTASDITSDEVWAEKPGTPFTYQETMRDG